MQACILITSIASHLSHSSLTPVSYNLSKMGMNRLVEHIHRDHGERDGVQAFAVHPVSCCCCCFILHLVVFVFLRDWIFFPDFSQLLLILLLLKGGVLTEGTKRHHETQNGDIWSSGTFPPTLFPSSLPFIHPLKPTIFLTTTTKKKIELTDDETLCGGFLTWLTSEKRPWLSGRYLSATWDVNELELKKDEIVNENKLVMRMVI